MSALRSRLTGFAALLLLFVLLIGIPVGLLAVAGNPLAGPLPDWQDLLRPDDGTLFLTVLVLIGWAAWASFAVSVLLELVATVRGRPVPRLPALHLQQQSAAGLLSAAALLFTLTGPALIASPAVAAPSTPTPAPPAATAPATVQPAGSAPTQASADTVPAPVHTVEVGETLWSIAERRLGDGGRYPDIAQLNYGRPQADGSTLTDSYWIRPGWQLQLPLVAGHDDPAPGAHLRIVQPGDTLSGIAEQEYGDQTAWPRIDQASRSITQPDGARLTDPDMIDVGWTLRIPTENPAAAGDTGPTAPSPPAETPAAPPAAPPAAAAVPSRPADPPSRAPAAVAPTPAAATGPIAPNPTGSSSRQQPTPTATTAGTAEVAPDDGGLQVRTLGGVGALLAAGVLTLIAARRATQQRRRPPGGILPLPEGPAADLEQQLRATADPLSVHTVDLALRTLAHDCSTSGQPLPVVRAARLTDGQFDLYLAEPADLPTPWAGTTDRTVWSLPAGSTGLLDPTTAADVSAPYPSLVTIGHDDEHGNVLLDLEHLGALGIAGGTFDDTREVLAAIAVELATSQWADDLQVTLVGAYPELGDCLQTGRIRYLPAAGHLLDELTRQAASDRACLARAHATDLQHARAAGTATDTWTPHIVLLAGPLPDQQRSQLEQLLQQLPRTAVAAVATGDRLGEWALRLQDAGAVLEPIGLQIRPQRITDQDYARLLEVLAVADQHDDQVDDAPDPAEPALAEIPDSAAEPEPATSMRIVDPTNPNNPPHQADGPTIDLNADNPLELDTTQPPAEFDGDQTDVIGSTFATSDRASVDTETAQLDGDPADGPPTVAAPRVLLLGPPQLTGTHGVLAQPSHTARMLELAAILTLRPPALTTEAIRDQVFGSARTRPTNKTVNEAVSRLRRWLGGEQYLPYATEGRYGLGPTMTSDWQDWHDLLPDGATGASTHALEQALSLVRGRPLQDVTPRSYSWAEPDLQTMSARIVDAAYELGRRQLMEGRPRSALQTTAIGIQMQPVPERLWRLRVMAAHSSNEATVRDEAIDELLHLSADLGESLEAATRQLLADLDTMSADPDGGLASPAL